MACSCRTGCVYCESDGEPIPSEHWLIGRPAAPPPFAAELVAVMTAGSWKVSDAAREAGMSESNLSGLRRGRWQPTPETGRRLAALLDAPQLVALAADGRKVDCPVCRKVFVAAGRKPARYCSRRCYITDYSRQRQRSRRGHQRVGLWRAAEYQDAVAAFCRACEPDLTCKRAECPLRPVSPLPLARLDGAESKLPAGGKFSVDEPQAIRLTRRMRRRRDPAPATHPGEITGTKPWHNRWW